MAALVEVRSVRWLGVAVALAACASLVVSLAGCVHAQGAGWRARQRYALEAPFETVARAASETFPARGARLSSQSPSRVRFSLDPASTLTLRVRGGAVVVDAVVNADSGLASLVRTQQLLAAVQDLDGVGARVSAAAASQLAAPPSAPDVPPAAPPAAPAPLAPGSL